MPSPTLSHGANPPIAAVPPAGGMARPAGNAVTQRPNRRVPIRSAVAGLLFEPRVHRTRADLKESLGTAANCVTAGRFVLTTGVMLLAIVEHWPLLLLGGLFTSWVLDVVDGQLARASGRESVIGAQLDILADRATATWVVLGLVVLDGAAPLTVAAAAAVWIQLSFFDQLLSSQFLRFGHWSPDEFHLEDRDVWRLNWAPAAKLLGNLPLGLLALGLVAFDAPSRWLALALATALVLVRVVSYLRIALRIERVVTIAGHYDPVADLAWLRIDGRDDGELQAAASGVRRELDQQGRVVGVWYERASALLPSDLLDLLPPPGEAAQQAASQWDSPAVVGPAVST